LTYEPNIRINLIILIAYMTETFLTSYSHSNFTQSSVLTPIQSQLDGIVSTFIDRAMDTYSLVGVTSATWGNRLTRLGSLSFVRPFARFAPRTFATLVPLAVEGAGLAVEATLFGVVPRIMKAGLGNADLSSLQLYGAAGIGNEVVHSGVSLLGLRLAGILSARESAVVQNIFQTSAMVGSQRFAGLLGITEMSRESLWHQLIDSEATILQLWTGMGMLHHLAPSFAQSEQVKNFEILTHKIGKGDENIRKAQSEFALQGQSGVVCGLEGYEVSNPLTVKDYVHEMSAKAGTTKGNATLGRKGQTWKEVQSELNEVAEKIEKMTEKYIQTILGIYELSRKYSESTRSEQAIEGQLRDPLERLEKKLDPLLKNYEDITIDISVLEQTQNTQKVSEIIKEGDRILQEAEDFYKGLSLPKLPQVPYQSVAFGHVVLEGRSQSFRRVCENLEVEPLLVEQILGMVHEFKNKEILSARGLEGLEKLIQDPSPKDEIEQVTPDQAERTIPSERVISFLRYIADANPPHSDSLRELLTLARWVEYGFIRRNTAMKIIDKALYSHEKYPRLGGPFIELVAQANSPSRYHLLASPILNFAVEHHHQGNWVTVEPVRSVGYATLLVKTPSGERYRYVTASFLKELKDKDYFDRVADRAVVELVNSQKMDPQLELRILKRPSRIYLHIPKVDRKVVDSVTLWARNIFDRYADLNIERVEVDYPEKNPLTGIIERKRKVIDPQSAAREEALASLRRKKETARLGSAARAEVIGNLADHLEEAGSAEEALQELRAGFIEHPHDKFIRSRLNTKFGEKLDEILPGKLGRVLFDPMTPTHSMDPKLVDLFSIFFGKTFDIKALKKHFDLDHPDFDFGVVVAVRDGNELQVKLPIVTKNVEPVAEFLVNIGIPSDKSEWRARWVRAHVKKGYRNRGITTFSVKNSIDFMKELGVSEVRMIASDLFWFALGGSFVDSAQRTLFGQIFKNLLEEEGMSLYTMRSPSRTDDEVYAAKFKHLTSRNQRKLLKQLLEANLQDIHFLFSLNDNSPQLKRFYERYSQTHRWEKRKRK
jgi:hypothetical protein